MPNIKIITQQALGFDNDISGFSLDKAVEATLSDRYLIYQMDLTVPRQGHVIIHELMSLKTIELLQFTFEVND